MNGFVIDDQELPLQRLYRWERERPNEVYLTQPLSASVRDWTWAQTMEEVRRIAAHLKSLGLEPGSRIGLYSKNCAWWLIADYAIWMAGHVSVPIFPTLTPKSVHQILGHSEARCCFVGRVDNWALAKTGIPDGMPLIAFPGSPAVEATPWEDVLAQHAPLEGNPVRAGDEVATLMYTSGTTGHPKGVMHTFNSFAVVPKCWKEHPGIGLRSSDHLFCYLSLAHVAERVLIEACSIHVGARVYFNESMQTFAEDLRRARPQIFFAVPRLWVQFQLGVFARLPEAELRKQFDDPVTGPAFKRQVLIDLGLDQCRMSGGSGAAMPPGVLAWYRDLGLELAEGYGMTENFACCTANVSGDNKIGTVGRPMPGVELRLSEAGEIQMRAPWVMKGYFLNPEATREAFTEDGWLKTGDKGVIDEDGRLRLTGRIKEIFKTAKGKYVAPAPIENKIQLGGNVEAVCVTGADRPQPLALILLPAPIKDAVQRDMEKRAQIETAFLQRLNELNPTLDPHERLEFIVIVADAWTQESGHVTGTLKIKRDSIEASYGMHYDAWAAQRKQVVWHGF